MSNLNSTSRLSSQRSRPPSDEDIYLMVMLYQHQHMSCEKIARRFSMTTAQVREIIARRSNSGCCG